MIGRDRAVGAMLEHDLVVVLRRLVLLLGLQRQVDVDALLRQRQRSRQKMIRSTRSTSISG